MEKWGSIKYLLQWERRDGRMVCRVVTVSGVLVGYFPTRAAALESLQSEDAS